MHIKPLYLLLKHLHVFKLQLTRTPLNLYFTELSGAFFQLKTLPLTCLQA